jgi:hypothetical protein
MKKHLFLMMMTAAVIAVSGYAQTTPRYAASTKTWKFGNQTWSDAIRIPECNKVSFTEDDDNPQCRSYTNGVTPRYYYNWAYVNANAAKLCPSPWRAPTRKDFITLRDATNHTTLISAWGYGGLVSESSMDDVSEYGLYWSATEGNSTTAYTLDYGSSRLHVGYADKYLGMQVRCVR